MAEVMVGILILLLIVALMELFGDYILGIFCLSIWIAIAFVIGKAVMS